MNRQRDRGSDPWPHIAALHSWSEEKIDDTLVYYSPLVVLQSNYGMSHPTSLQHPYFNPDPARSSSEINAYPP